MTRTKMILIAVGILPLVVACGGGGSSDTTTTPTTTPTPTIAPMAIAPTVTPTPMPTVTPIPTVIPTPTPTMSTSTITGTVPGTLIEAFGSDGSYISTKSTKNGTTKHPFSLTLSKNISYRIVMTTNEDDINNKVVTPIGFITPTGTGTLFTASKDTIDLGYIDLKLSRADIIDSTGDGVSDEVLTLTVSEGINSVVLADDKTDVDGNDLVDVYEDDDGDGLNNKDDKDDDGNGILDENEADDKNDDGMNGEHSNDKNDDGKSDDGMNNERSEDKNDDGKSDDGMNNERSEDKNDDGQRNEHSDGNDDNDDMES